VLVEPSLEWVPFYLELLDRHAATYYDFPAIKEKPSTYFRRQMNLTFVEDPRGLQVRHELGIENIMWSTDFPHPATSWPNSRAVVEKQFEGIPEDERQLIVSGNAARVYGL
jgi:predicted TIM-barrel fold metal-dependent hydrolase